MTSLVFTCGDINGIGPEIIIKTLNTVSSFRNKQIIIVCPGNVFEKTASVVQPLFDYTVIKAGRITPSLPGGVILADTGRTAPEPGIPTARSGSVAYKALMEGIRLVRSAPDSALVTAPVSKHAFELAGIPFSGHTEILGSQCCTSEYLMTFLSRQMKAALLSIHVPLSQVPGMITEERIITAAKIIRNAWESDFGINSPEIAVLGLNPHAGEMGRIGNEEELIIKPAIRKIKEIYKLKITGPFVPDAFFGNRLYKKFDAVLAMYHDQALIPFKLLNFDSGVNYTAGLPIVRTSPDHGTAFDIAYQGIASPSSMISAMRYAEKIIKNRIGYAGRKDKTL